MLRRHLLRRLLSEAPERLLWQAFRVTFLDNAARVAGMIASVIALHFPRLRVINDDGVAVIVNGVANPRSPA